MNSTYAWLAAILWTLAILVGILMPGGSLPDGPGFEFDKFVHFLLFFIFSVLWMRAGSSKYMPLWVLAGGLLYGIGTEYAQGLLPVARTPDPIDAAINAAGTLTGITTQWLWENRELSEQK